MKRSTGRGLAHENVPAGGAGEALSRRDLELRDGLQISIEQDKPDLVVAHDEEPLAAPKAPPSIEGAAEPECAPGLPVEQDGIQLEKAVAW